jgi:large subunit ribosomal protein L21
MYAIIETGGKQYKAEPNAVLKLERLAGEVGDTVQFDKVLLVAEGDDIEVGRPYVEDKPVLARIVEHGRHPKIIIYKYKKRKDYQKKQGHRQNYTAVEIESIGPPAATVETVVESPEMEATAEE